MILGKFNVEKSETAATDFHAREAAAGKIFYLSSS